MVLGKSKDVIGKALSFTFESTAKAFLFLSFAFLGVFSILLGFVAYPTRMTWFLVLLGIFVSCIIIGEVVSRWTVLSRPKLSKARLVNFGKKNMTWLFAFVIALCFMIILFANDEQYVIPSFVVGSVLIAILTANSVRLKRRK